MVKSYLREPLSAFSNGLEKASQLSELATHGSDAGLGSQMSSNQSDKRRSELRNGQRLTGRTRHLIELTLVAVSVKPSPSELQPKQRLRRDPLLRLPQVRL